MGVDSNVLIFERIKEELADAQGPRVRGQGRLHARLADHRRHACHVAHRRGVPLSVRHRSDSRLCDHAGDRPAGERLHRGVRLAHAVRGRAQAPTERLRTLSIGRSQLFANARANFTRWRWHALALSLVVIGAGAWTIVTRGVTLGIDFSGGTLVVVEYRTGRRDRGAGASRGLGSAGRCDRAALRRRRRPPVPDSPAARVVGQRRPGGHGPRRSRDALRGIRPARVHDSRSASS